MLLFVAFVPSSVGLTKALLKSVPPEVVDNDGQNRQSCA